MRSRRGCRHEGTAPALSQWRSVLRSTPSESGDATDRGARLGQPCRFGEVRLPLCRAEHLRRRRRRDERFGGGRIRRDIGGARRHGRLSDATCRATPLVALDRLAHRTAQAAQHVPPVSDLNGGRRALSCALCVGAGAISRDDFDAWMLLKPVRQSVSLSVRQQFHDLVAFKVHQDGPVAMALAPSPVIDAKHARSRSGLGLARDLAGRPQQRIRADGHGQSIDKSCACFTAHRQADASMQGADAFGAASMRPGDIAQALGEGMTRAGRRRAPEPPRRDLQRHRTTLPWQVAQHAGAPAMHPVGNDAAIGTAGAHASRPGQDPHAIRCRHDLLDCKCPSGIMFWPDIAFAP